MLFFIIWMADETYFISIQLMIKTTNINEETSVGIVNDKQYKSSNNFIVIINTVINSFANDEY